MDMRAFTTTELSRMQATQEAAMQDTCRLGAYRSTEDGYNNPAPEYVYGVLLDCGVEHVQPDEVQDTGLIPALDVRIRLPIDTAVDDRDRVMVTHRYGVEIANPAVYEIVGPVKRGPSGLVLECREVGGEL